MRRQAAPNVDAQTLRILLLGKKVSENCRVGNFILNSDLFKNENSPSNTKHQCSLEGGGELTKNYVYVAVINNSQLLQRHLSDDEITEAMKECVNLSAPGPHVFILVLQHNEFSEEDMQRVKYVLRQFSKEAMERTIMVMTDEEIHSTVAAPANLNAITKQLTEECGGGCLQFKDKMKIRSKIFKKMKKIMKREDYNKTEIQKSHPTMDTDDNESADNLSEDDKNSESQIKVKSGFILSKIPHFWQKRERSPDGNRPNMSKLNVLVCGSDGSLKSSMSELILQHTHRRSESGHGRLINVLELPALFNTGLSEEEVMRQTLRCVSRCHPGVHAFLCTVPVGPLSMDNKAEIEKIQNIFDCRDQFMVIFTSEMTVLEPVMDFVKATVQSNSFMGQQYKVIDLKETQNSEQIPELLDYIEKMKAEPYSLQMYVEAQVKRVRCETEEKYKEELKIMENEIKVLRGAECKTSDPECLRIVLIGRTGSGKSATGNTILGRNEFLSQLRPVSVTTVCKKGFGEVDGRSVAVVDTPGLFDTTLTKELVLEEIVKCVSLSAPGPHVFVIVLSLGRFTKEETDTIDLIKKIFGLKSAQFSIVLFTRGDDLEDQSIEDYVSKYNCAELQKLIRDCGNRFLAFNNKEKQDKTQVMKLLKMIEEVRNNNQGGYFTNSMFEEAEMSIKKKMEEIMKEREREILKQREELQDKYEMEMKRLEEEKQRAEEERRKMEKQLKEKEQNLRKEFEEKEKTDQKKREIENQKRSEEEKQQRAEYDQRIEEMMREIDNQRSQYEQQQKEREEEDRKREEKYREEQNKMRNEQERIIAELKMKHEEETKLRDLEKKRRNKEEEEERQRWEKRIKEAENDRRKTQEEIKEKQREWEDEKKRQMKEREEEERKREEKYRQDQEKMKNENESAMAELKKKQDEEIKMRDSEDRKRIKQEEKERKEWERKINEADNERKQIKRQQREWEDEMKRRLRERGEEERKRKEKHEEQLREKQEELEKMRKRFEGEREEERQKMEEERLKQRREREEKEREYEEKRQETKRHYEQLERERKEEWERRKHEDEERREKERKKWKKMIEDLKREQEEEIRRREAEEKERQKREEKERDEMKQKHEEEIKQIKKKHEEEARKQAEESNDFRERKEQHVQELQQMLEERQKQQELLEKLFQHLKDEKSEEVKELKAEIEDLKKKWCRLM